MRDSAAVVTRKIEALVIESACRGSMTKAVMFLIWMDHNWPLRVNTYVKNQTEPPASSRCYIKSISDKTT